MKTLLITGGTGYLGGCIVKHAVERGHQVRILTRQPAEALSLPKGVEPIPGDVLDEETVQKSMESCDGVIHSAALVSIWEKNPLRFYQINVEGTKNIMRAAKKARIGRVVYTSSFFALGPTEEKPVDESWRNLDEPLPTEYARSKVFAENWVREWQDLGNEVMIVYPGIIYGPGKETQGNYISKLIGDYARGKLPGVIGKGDKRMTFSYIDDVAKGHLLALEHGKPKAGYILGGEDATMVELFAMLHEITGVKPPRMKIPYFACLAMAGIEELRATFAKNHLPLLTRESLKVYRRHWRYSSQKAISEIGYTRTPLKIGLLKTLESLGLAPKEGASTIL